MAASGRATSGWAAGSRVRRATAVRRGSTIWTPAARAQLARAATPYATCLTDAEWALRALCGPDMTGDGIIIDPRGEVIAGPAQRETILLADVSLEAVAAAKAVCDVAGHYARPDVFQVRVDGEPIGRVMPAQAEPVRRADALGQSRPRDTHAGPGGAEEVKLERRRGRGGRPGGPGHARAVPARRGGRARLGLPGSRRGPRRAAGRGRPGLRPAAGVAGGQPAGALRYWHQVGPIWAGDLLARLRPVPGPAAR